MNIFNVYFDLETYKEGMNEKYPLGGVYGVVCSYHEGRTYDISKPLETKVFIGARSLYDFLDYLEQEFGGIGKSEVYLHAYNMPYDFCFMRHDLIRYWNIKSMNVRMDDSRKILLSGAFTYKNIRFHLIDLNMFQRSYSLASWIKEIHSKYTKNGKKLIVPYRIDGKIKYGEIEKKLKIDYDKWDVYEDPNEVYPEYPQYKKLYYKNSNGENKLLDIKQEYDYILIDGLAMPLIFREIYRVKCNFIKILRNEFKDKMDEIDFRDMITEHGFWLKQSVSSVSKCLAEMYIQQKFNEVFRFDLRNEVQESARATREYMIQTNSLLGGLTVGNEKYPYYVAGVNEKLESYDVNSMYPFIMHNGMPAYELTEEEPQGKELELKDGELTGDYVTWCLIKGTEDEQEPFIEWKENFIWNGKLIECPQFDNGILGKGFIYDTKVKHGFYVSKNYWDLINTCCNHNLKLENMFYQVLSKEMGRYIKELNEIKMNSKKGTAENTTAKLAMNSLYGKTLEGNHMAGVIYGKDVNTYKQKETESIQYNRRGFNLERKGVDGILPVIKEAPKLPCRMAGVYVTNTARLILLTGIFDEVANGNEFLYADTDSIKLIVRNPVKLSIDSKKLGRWKKEGSKKENPETGKPYYMEFNEWRYPLKTKRYAIWNNEYDISYGRFAFAGLTAKIRNEFKTSFERVEALFDCNSNILFLDGRTATIRNPHTDQPIIYNVDLMTNNKIYPTHLATYNLDTDSWTFNQFKEKELLKFGKILVNKHDTYETNLLKGWYSGGSRDHLEEN